MELSESSLSCNEVSEGGSEGEWVTETVPGQPRGRGREREMPGHLLPSLPSFQEDPQTFCGG